jgi:hypothetical protein
MKTKPVNPDLIDLVEPLWRDGVSSGNIAKMLGLRKIKWRDWRGGIATDARSV